jgi:hypothetical protein
VAVEPSTVAQAARVRGLSDRMVVPRNVSFGIRLGMAFPIALSCAHRLCSHEGSAHAFSP